MVLKNSPKRQRSMRRQTSSQHNWRESTLELKLSSLLRVSQRLLKHLLIVQIWLQSVTVTINWIYTRLYLKHFKVQSSLNWYRLYNNKDVRQQTVHNSDINLWWRWTLNKIPSLLENLTVNSLSVLKVYHNFKEITH